MENAKTLGYFDHIFSNLIYFRNAFIAYTAVTKVRIVRTIPNLIFFSIMRR